MHCNDAGMTSSCNRPTPWYKGAEGIQHTYTCAYNHTFKHVARRLAGLTHPHTHTHTHTHVWYAYMYVCYVCMFVCVAIVHRLLPEGPSHRPPSLNPIPQVVSLLHLGGPNVRLLLRLGGEGILHHCLQYENMDESHKLIRVGVTTVQLDQPATKVAMNGWMDGWMDGCMVDGWMNTCEMDGWMDGWMDGA